jgi:transcriptional regulator with XRE-family HTH domain
MTGLQLKQFRHLKNLTQAQLADSVKVAILTIQRNESARQVSKRLKNRLKDEYPDLMPILSQLSNLTIVR